MTKGIEMARRDEEYDPREEYPEDWDAEYEPTSDQVERHERYLASLDIQVNKLRSDLDSVQATAGFLVLTAAFIIGILACIAVIK